MTTKRPRKIDLDYSFKMRTLDVFANLGSRAIPWLGLFGIFFLGLKICEAVAGKVTYSQIAFGLFADIKTTGGIAKAVLGIFGVSGVTYGIKERTLRRKDIAGRSEYIQQLERKVDPTRTSSRLTKHGTSQD